MSSPILRGGNLIVTEQGIRDGVRQVMIPLWNAWYFFSLYANAARGGRGYDAKINGESVDVLDRYILAKTQDFVVSMARELDALNVAAACDATRGFLEVLSNWYIRRSRDRFWDGESEASFAAFDTLFTVLETTTRAVAPLLPLTAEEIWRGLTGARSVHLTDWPTVGTIDVGLVAAMDRVREVCSAGSALRKAENLRVRLPLSGLTVVADDADALRPYAALISDELNVRELLLTDLGAAGDDAFGVRQVMRVNARAAGPRLGKDVQQAIKASKSGDWSIDAEGNVVAGGISLLEGECTVQTVVADADPDDQRAVAVLPSGGFVILDTAVTPELAAEGLARDVVRAVQQARRDAGLDVSDRIRLRLAGEEDVAAAIEAHADLIKTETLAISLTLADDVASGLSTASVGHQQRIGLALERA
jgi:isoleucyl-tRNA synthetase